MAADLSLQIVALITDSNIGADGHFVPPGHVVRRATFTVAVPKQDGDATLEAVFAGERGRPLVVWEVTHDDLNLPRDKALELAQAIYDGHYGVEDHDRPVQRSRLTGQLNVEPYWENIISEKFVTAV